MQFVENGFIIDDFKNLNLPNYLIMELFLIKEWSEHEFDMLSLMILRKCNTFEKLDDKIEFFRSSDSSEIKQKINEVFKRIED